MEQQEPLEHTLLINRSVKVYRIPPRPAAGGHRSGEWRVADEIFAGRLRMLARGEQVELRLEDSATGELFAVCPFTPDTSAVAVEPAADSSRNFVLRVEDPASQRHAFLGLGFAERGEAFDFNAAIADHAKQCQRERAIQQQRLQQPQQASGHAGAAAPNSTANSGGAAGGLLLQDPGDLSLKEGVTFRIDVRRPSRQQGGFLSRAAAPATGAPAGPAGAQRLSSGGGGGQAMLLPPPPILPPPAAGLPVLPRPPAAAAAGPAATASSQEGWATFE